MCSKKMSPIDAIDCRKSEQVQKQVCEGGAQCACVRACTRARAEGSGEGDRGVRGSEGICSVFTVAIQ